METGGSVEGVGEDDREKLRRKTARSEGHLQCGVKLQCCENFLMYVTVILKKNDWPEIIS